MKFKFLKLLVLQVLIMLFLNIYAVYSQNKDDLILYAQDVRIEERPELGGFFLYVRKNPGVGSVLLTESAETPQKDLNTYALRTSAFNDINGNERRVLNGRFIQPKTGYFIVDSTADPDVQFGSAFILLLPYNVEFGYENTRNKKLDLRKEGLYLSIRTFKEPYANYTGAYLDNSFYLERKFIEVAQVPDLAPDLPPLPTPVQASPPTPEPKVEAVEPVSTQEQTSDLGDLLSQGSGDKYSPETVTSFTNIAKRAKGKVLFAENKNDIVEQISKILMNLPKSKSSDIVIALDTTRSMWDDLSVIKSRLIPAISKIMRSEVYRLGMVLYRDYDEDYITQVIPFNDQLDGIQKALNAIQAGGGGDWPEAVYESLYVAINDFTWVAENRILFIVGDAPPHEPPTSKIDLDQMYSLAVAKKLTVYPLIVPRRD